MIRLALASSQLFTTSFSVEAMVAWTRTLAKTVRETQGQLILRYVASWGGSIRARLMRRSKLPNVVPKM